jgi:four helix bundle protein
MDDKSKSSTPRHFTDLKVWKDAHDLYLLALKDVENFPNSKGAYNLIDQLLRSIGSISANIAEGFNRRSTKHYISYLDNSVGSTNEAENWYYKIEGAGWLGSDMIRERVEKLTEIRKMLCSLIRSLNG